MDSDSTGLTVSQRRGVAQRLRLALGRFGQQVERVTVRLSGVANPLGGVDRCCQMRAWLRQGGSIAVQTSDGSAAIERAVTRLTARVEWAIADALPEPPTRWPLEALPARGPGAGPAAGPHRRRGAARARPRRA